MAAAHTTGVHAAHAAMHVPVSGALRKSLSTSHATSAQSLRRAALGCSVTAARVQVYMPHMHCMSLSAAVLRRSPSIGSVPLLTSERHCTSSSLVAACAGRDASESSHRYNQRPSAARHWITTLPVVHTCRTCGHRTRSSRCFAQTAESRRCCNRWSLHVRALHVLIWRRRATRRAERQCMRSLTSIARHFGGSANIGACCRSRRFAAAAAATLFAAPAACVLVGQSRTGSRVPAASLRSLVHHTALVT